VGRQVRTSSRCGASERTALWMPVCCGTVFQIGLSPAWSERSRTSPSIAETTSAATSAGVICDRVVSTCTECSPKKSTVESNPAGGEEIARQSPARCHVRGSRQGRSSAIRPVHRAMRRQRLNPPNRFNSRIVQREIISVGAAIYNCFPRRRFPTPRRIKSGSKARKTGKVSTGRSTQPT